MFTKKQKLELITSIKATGEIPIKFAYLDKGAKNYEYVSNIRVNTENTINSNETILLNKRIRDIISTYENKSLINVIDLGCGTGKPILPILKYLNENNIPFRYIPIDISDSMLDLAKKTISKEYGNIEIIPFNIDFEQGQFSDIIYNLKKENSVNLLCFLGSTLGNHFNRERVLTNMRDSMSSDDYMLIGVELFNIYKVNNLINKYKIKGSYEFVIFIPNYFGIKDNQINYNVSWNPLLNQIEQKMFFKEDIFIKIDSEKIKLEKDDFLLLGKSYKFTMNSIVKLLQDTGFRIELLMTSSKKDYLLTLIQPSRY